MTETWLSSSISTSAVAIDGYDFIRQDRGSHGDAVGIYIEDFIKHKIIHIANSVEKVCIKINCFSKKILLSVIYRPPNSNCSLFIDELENLVTGCLPILDDVIILEDININLLNQSRNNAVAFLNLLNSLNLTQVISLPIRLSRHGESLINHIITSNTDLINNAKVMTVSIADHELISCIICEKTECSEQFFRFCKNFKNFDVDKFLQCLNKNIWNQYFMHLI